MIRLTNEEISLIIKKYKECPNQPSPSGRNELAEQIAKAQVGRIGEWGIQPCLEHVTGGGVFTRRECPKCWQVLLGEK